METAPRAAEAARGSASRRALEDELQRELEVALRVRPSVRRGRDPPGVRVVVAGHTDLRVRVAQVYVVEDIHRLDAELELLVLGETEALEQRRIRAPVPGTAELVARQVAERADRRTPEGAARRSNRRGVEPLVAGLRPTGIADQIRTVRSGVAVGRRVPVRHVERQPALDDRRLVELPSAKEAVAARPRQFVQRRDREIVLAVPVGGAVLEVRQVEELIAAMLALALQRVVRLHRVAVAEALRQLRLQRVITVRRAVAEDVESLRPSVLDEVR